MLATALSLGAADLREPLLLPPDLGSWAPWQRAGGQSPAPSPPDEQTGVGVSPQAQERAALAIQSCWRGHCERRRVAHDFGELYFELLKRLAMLWEEHGAPLSYRSTEFLRHGLGRVSVLNVLRVNAAVEDWKRRPADPDCRLGPLGERKVLMVYLKTFTKEERVALYERWGIPLHSKHRLQELVFHFLWNPGLGLEGLGESARFVRNHVAALSDPQFAPSHDRLGSNALLLYQLERQISKQQTQEALRKTKSGAVGLEYARLMGSSVRASIGLSPAKKAARKRGG